MNMSKAFVLFSATLLGGAGAVKTVYNSPETDAVTDWTGAKAFCEAKKSKLITKKQLCDYFASNSISGDTWSPALDHKDVFFQVGKGEDDFCEEYDREKECGDDTSTPTTSPTKSSTQAPVTSKPTPGPTEAPVTSKPTPGPTEAPVTPKPSASPTEGEGGGLCHKPQDCTTQSCAYTCDLPVGYYPDATDCRSYCYCTGTNAPSRYETVTNNDMLYDPWGRNYWTDVHGPSPPSYRALTWSDEIEPLGGMNGGIANWYYNNKNLEYCGNNYDRKNWRTKSRRLEEDTCDVEPNYIVCDKIPDGSSSGDPHFKTWGGEKFDYHGACDLVLLDNPGFMDGLGMKIHIRTKHHKWWSYIEAAVLQIGEDTLELMGGKESVQYWHNGQTGEMKNGDASFGDFPLVFKRKSAGRGRMHVDLGKKNAISLETFDNFVRVNVKTPTEKFFQGSVGLLGSYPEGIKVARDGSTVLENADEYGQEWQVHPSEPMLFHNASHADPLKCTMPDTAQKSRRLQESTLTSEDAAIACAGVPEDDRDDCIFDVLATDDKHMAESY